MVDAVWTNDSGMTQAEMDKRRAAFTALQSSTDRTDKSLVSSAQQWLNRNVVGNELSGTGDYRPTAAVWDGTRFIANPATASWEAQKAAQKAARSAANTGVVGSQIPATGTPSVGGATPVTTPAPASGGIISGSMSTPNTMTPEQVAQYNPFGAVQPVTNYQAQTSQVDPATQTVEGRVASLLSQDNELMQRARAMSQGEMAGKGLVNSTMAVQAGTAAAMDKALQIATPDAQMYAERDMFNTDQVNTGGMFNAGEANKLAMTGADIASKFGLQQNEFKFTSGESALDRASNEKLTNLKIQSDAALSKAQMAHDAAMTNLKVAADAANTDKGIGAQMALAKAQQEFQGTQSELDRLQQVNLQLQQQSYGSAEAEKDRAAQTSIISIQQAFQGQQAELDRSNQRYLVEYQTKVSQANIPKAQVADITVQLQQSIAGIAASPDMDPAAKDAQIANAYTVANASIQTLSTLYDTPLVGVGNVGTIAPGGNVMPPAAPAPGIVAGATTDWSRGGA